MVRNSFFRNWPVVLPVLLLSACSGGGGGGGVGSTPPPSPTPAPVPTPTPTPPPVNDTAEYRATVGAVSMNALTAYDHGATGAGVKAAIIDSGVDVDSEEFAGRISSASTNTAGSGTIDDVGGHGTAVAFTLAGRRNGTGTHGVAFGAELIVLRTDTAGSCADTGPDGGCNHEDSAIAQAIDVARTNGARVINLSLGGSAPDSNVLAAMTRATSAGIVIVISAGNDGDKPEGINPDLFAGVPAGNNAVSHGLIIIAGSVGSDNLISDFSNRAGSGAQFYLAAVGEQVRAPDENNVPFFWSGTSFSAPQIAGAVALLAQAFPNLTGQQIVDILFTSARDAGTAGTDGTYGRGILDLTRAFQPLGATSIAGTGAPASLSLNGQLSAPMGDAAQGSLGAVILDGYDRAYALDLARTINRQGPARRLAGMIASRERHYAAGAGGMAVSVTIAPRAHGVAIERTVLREPDAEGARALAATVSGTLGGGAQFAFGASESGTSLVARLAGRADPAFLIARDPTGSSGFDSLVGGSVAVRQSFGGWGVSVAGEQGEVLTPLETDMAALRWRRERHGYSRMTIGVDRRFGGLRAGLALTRLDETETVLGARFTGALGGARGESLFVDLGARWDAGDGWSLGGSLRQGWTVARLRGGVEGSGLIRTSGFAADLGKTGVFGPGDRIGLRIAQPLRVASGGIGLKLPAEWDYETGMVSRWNAQRLNLAPSGRELDFELGYAWMLAGGDISTHAFLRRDPGNYAALSDDYGAALRWSVGF